MIDKIHPVFLPEDILSFTFTSCPYHSSKVDFHSQLNIITSLYVTGEVPLDAIIMFNEPNYKRLWAALHEYNRNLVVLDIEFLELLSITTNPTQPEHKIILLKNENSFYIVHHPNFLNVLKHNLYIDPFINSLSSIFLDFELPLLDDFDIVQSNIFDCPKKGNFLPR